MNKIVLAWLVYNLFVGIGLWSPGLDKYGNSYKGMAFMELLSQTFNFHRYEGKELTSKAI